MSAGRIGPRGDLRQLEPSLEDPNEFWQRAEENLRAGNVRLIFACDQILPGLQRVIEFLNERMDPTEVLALRCAAYKHRTKSYFTRGSLEPPNALERSRQVTQG